MADNNNNEEAGAAAPQEPQARIVLYCGGKIFDWQFFFGFLPPLSPHPLMSDLQC